ncbi:MAG: hypothetical protein ACYC5X_04910 [Syntrophales bacterium]
MIVSFRNLEGKIQRVSAEITTPHSSPSGQPALVSSDGDVVDKESWVVLGYHIVSATTKERYGLTNLGFI